MTYDVEPIASCIRNVANFSVMKPAYLMERPDFHPELLKLTIPMASPKLETLFEKIAQLDAKDQRQTGKLFKHMIFTDVHNSQYGVKLLASAFAAKGFTPAFHAVGTGFGMRSVGDLEATQGQNFGVLCSKKFMERNMSVRFRKALLETYNVRPENTHGERVRFMILDQGFKEGIDLFDVKYIHLFEPLTVRADEKQAIGRGTRFCGQKGLEFHPRFGWTLYVFRYDVRIPEDRSTTRTFSEMYLEYSNIDLRRVQFSAELERASQDAAVDHALTAPVHQFKMEIPPPALEGGAGKVHPEPPYRIMNYGSMGNYIRNHFMRYKYPVAKLENLCDGAHGGAPQLVQFTPTQNFVRHYFQPSSAYKGLLLYHGTGVGKTCTAIATATHSFEKEGYTILWVTRHTLKSDIWKNMFKQVCAMGLRKDIRKGELHLPEKISGPMKYLSDSWMEPMSYKQFTNMLLKKNRFYDEILQRNGAKDPLRKTLIIIDEAHKLYASNAPASEKPNVETFEKMIQHSYRKSGKESCRVLLMTATPFTEDGMEMIKLLNLLKEKRDHMPTDFEDFSKQFLDKDGKFTKIGLSHFRNEVSGYISYLNRSQDGRNFAHPVVEDVVVDMTRAPDKENENAPAMNPAALELAAIKKELALKKTERQGIKKQAQQTKKECVATLRQEKAQCKEEVKDKHSQDIENAKVLHQHAVENCNTLPRTERAPCKQMAKDEWKHAKANAKQTYQSKQNQCDQITSKDSIQQRCGTMYEEIVGQHNKVIEELMEDKKEMDDVIKEKRARLRTLTEDASKLRSVVKQLYDRRKEVAARMAQEKTRIQTLDKEDERKQAMLQLRKGLGVEFKEINLAYKTTRAKMNLHINDKKVLRIQDGKAKLGDLSQETALQKRCHVML